MSDYLKKIVYLTDDQYSKLIAGTLNIGGQLQQYDNETLYVTTSTLGLTENDIQTSTTGDGITFIDTITQDNKGQITAKKHTIRNATNSDVGVITVPSDSNRLMWRGSNNDSYKLISGTHYIDSNRVAINSESQPSENFYVSGNVNFNIGSSDDTTNQKKFKISGNSRFLSFAGSGIQAYTTANNTDSAGTLNLQYYGGILNIGNNTLTSTTYNATTATINWDTATMTGTFTFQTTSGFNYSGIEAASSNSSSNIWFSHSSKIGTPVYKDNFKYNPSTTTLTIGTGTLSATNYSGAANYLQGVDSHIETNSNAAIIAYPDNGRIQYFHSISKDTDGLFPNSNNANGILTINTYGVSNGSKYNHQLGFNGAGKLYHRACTSKAMDTTTAWRQIALLEVDGTLAVENGGTGATSFTSNAILVGNGSSAITNKNILIETSNNVNYFNFKMNAYQPNSTATGGWARILSVVRDNNDENFFRIGMYGPNPATVNYLYFGFHSTYNNSINAKLASDGTLTVKALTATTITTPTLTATSTMTISASTTLYIQSNSAASIIFRQGNTPTEIARFNPDGHFIPVADSTNQIGVSARPWYAIYATNFYGNLTGTATNVPLTGVNGADNLRAIEDLEGTSGFLKKTANNTWELDTSAYLTSHQTYTAVSGKKPTSNQTPSFGGTFDIEQVSQATNGQVSVTERTVTIPATIATNTAVGLIKPWYSHSVASTGPTTGTDDAAISVNTISTTAGRYYALEMDNEGRGFVNVPWTNLTTHVYINATASGATSNVATSNATTYIHLYDDTTKRDTIQIQGGGTTTVSATNGKVITISSSDISVTHTLGTTTKYYITGTTSATTSTGGDTFDTNIYTTTTEGELSAIQYSLNVSSVEKAHLVYNSTDDSIDFVFI